MDLLVHRDDLDVVSALVDGVGASAARVVHLNLGEGGAGAAAALVFAEGCMERATGRMKYCIRRNEKIAFQLDGNIGSFLLK